MKRTLGVCTALVLTDLYFPLQLADCNKLQNAVFDIFHAIVVLIKDGERVVNVKGFLWGVAGMMEVMEVIRN
jgi:hypothetical protein